MTNKLKRENENLKGKRDENIKLYKQLTRKKKKSGAAGQKVWVKNQPL